MAERVSERGQVRPKGGLAGDVVLRTRNAERRGEDWRGEYRDQRVGIGETAPGYIMRRLGGGCQKGTTQYTVVKIGAIPRCRGGRKEKKRSNEWNWGGGNQRNATSMSRRIKQIGGYVRQVS